MSVVSFINSPKLKFAVAILMVVSTLSGQVLARPSLNLAGGQTTVFLSTDFFSALGALKLSAGSIGDGSVRGGIANFPITGGVFDLQNAKGEINHSGGLFLSNSTTRVELSSFNIDTSGQAPVLTGLASVNGDFVGRLPLFTLELPQLTLPIQPQPFSTVFIPNVKVTLTPEAAQALNAVFNVTAFVAGFNIGQAQVYALGEPGRRPPIFGGRLTAPLEDNN
jgi:hypothetical protein